MVPGILALSADSGIHSINTHCLQKLCLSKIADMGQAFSFETGFYFFFFYLLYCDISCLFSEAMLIIRSLEIVLNALEQTLSISFYEEGMSDTKTVH